jgi:hypothetical protein
MAGRNGYVRIKEYSEGIYPSSSQVRYFFQ